MYFIWLVISLLCLIYYIVCVNYAGFSAAFVFMWLVAAVVFMAIFIAFRIIKMNDFIVPSWSKILFFFGGCYWGWNICHIRRIDHK